MIMRTVQGTRKTRKDDKKKGKGKAWILEGTGRKYI